MAPKTTFTGPLRSGPDSITQKGHVVSVARIEFPISSLSATATASKKMPRGSALSDVIYMQSAAAGGAVGFVQLGYGTSGGGQYDIAYTSDALSVKRANAWDAFIDKAKWQSTSDPGDQMYKSLDNTGTLTGTAAMFLLMTNGGAGYV